MQTFRESEVRRMLKQACVEFGSQKAFAAHIGVSAVFVSEILLGNKEPCGKVLGYLGLRKDYLRVPIFYRE